MSAAINNHFTRIHNGMFAYFLRALLAVALLAFASLSNAQAPQFRASSTMNGAGTLAFPVGSVSTDWLVMSVISTAAVPTPTGWTATASYAWTVYGYRSYVFTRQQGADTSVAVAPTSGSAIIVAYQNTSGIGAVGTFAESTATANAISLNSITPQNVSSKILGIVTDRDIVYPVPPPTGFTTSLNFNSSYFGQNISERAYGSTSPTGTPVWGQVTTYPAAGVLIELLPLSAPIVLTPRFRAASTINGTGTLNFPSGSVSTDWLVMHVISTTTVPTPAGWTLSASRNWTAYAYYSYVFTRLQGSATSVSVPTTSGSASIVAYQNTSGIGEVGAFAESTATASTISLNSIAPQNANSKVLGIVCDRDVAYPTPPAGFTSSLNFITGYFGQNISERAFGNTAPTGALAWGQGTTYPAVGVLLELLPLAPAAPTVTAAFTPATIVTGGSTTATLTLTNANFATLTAANFTAPLTNLSVASPSIGGTCTGVTNTPALVAGATALNLTIPSLPVGSCTITLSLTSTTVGTQSLATSGVTTTQIPVAGAASNTASLTVRATAFPATIATTFTPAWIGTGATSTLTFALTSPSAVALTNANFTDALANMTVAAPTIGGTCTGVTNSPALTAGAGALNLTIPTLPAAGCTVTVQVTSVVLGSNANAASGVTSVETVGAGAASNTAYLTVSPVDVGFSYVHADHLGTPRAITRPSDNAVVWEWKNDSPFGDNLANENPSGAGQFTYNNRFPGQYYDQETGTHFNWMRDYDPATGRYVQSDPIGLAGGINTFSYALGRPLELIDPSGRAAAAVGATLILGLGTALILSTPDGQKAFSNALGATAGVIKQVCDAANDLFDPCIQTYKGLVTYRALTVELIQQRLATLPMVVRFNMQVEAFNRKCAPMRVEPVIFILPPPNS
jgi:RHS repeat-associated protein